VIARLRPLVLLALAAGCLLAYHAVGDGYYDGFHLPQGRSMDHLPPEELAQAALFALFGGAALALLTAGLLGTPLPDRLGAVGRRLADRPWPVAAAAAGFVLVGSLAIGHLVLRRAPICDDENTYRFIGQTLERGHLMAPSPGGDLAFYDEQFVVINDKGRFGKYPVGFPALLALGRMAGAETLVVPLLTAGLVLLTALVGRSLYGGRTAALAALLLALSPQVLATGATWLSQPAAAVCLMIALCSLLAMERAGARRTPWAVATGLALGYGVLVRPMPGALFVAVALVYMAVRYRPRSAADLAAWVGLLAPIAAAALLMVVINRIQTGSALLTAYQTAHHNASLARMASGSMAKRASSVVGTLIRFDHWFLGWPLAAAFSLLARRSPQVGLLWGVVAAEMLYRVLTPKVGVGTAGPLYVFEALPAMALLTADGMRRLAERRPGDRLAALVPGKRLVPALLASGTLVAVAMFLPPRLGDLALAGSAHRLVDDLLAAQRIQRALVFHEQLVPPQSGLSWAYGPRDNGPLLDDDILFVNFWRDRPQENRKFWQRRYPDRPALYFGYQDGRPLLVGLDDYLGRLR
jgi:hypothetical protein